MWNLMRWVSPRAIKETFVPPTDYRYPFMQPDGDRRPRLTRPGRPGLPCAAARTAARRLRRQPGDALELLLCRLEEPLGRAEVAQDRPPARGADPLERVEDRLERARVAALAVEA